MTLSRRLTITTMLTAALAMLITLVGVAPAEGGAVRQYKVTIENLTSGQPLTPFVVATHSGSTSVFEVGEAASAGVQDLAENGGVPTLVAELEGNSRVSDVAVAASAIGPILPGESAYTMIESTPGARKLTAIGMLVCTNDGFSAVNSIQLNESGQTQVLYAGAYDAGTEVNTEAQGDLVPPCDGDMANGSPDENGVIHHHAGIQGGAFLSVATHGWTDPVIKVTIEPVG